MNGFKFPERYLAYGFVRALVNKRCTTISDQRTAGATIPENSLEKCAALKMQIK